MVSVKNSNFHSETEKLNSTISISGLCQNYKYFRIGASQVKIPI